VSDLPDEVGVAAFNDEKTADQAMTLLKVARWEKIIDFKNTAYITKKPDGKLRIKGTGVGKGTVIGGVIGGIVGLLAGPTGAKTVAAGGALVGGCWPSAIPVSKKSAWSRLGEGYSPAPRPLWWSPASLG